MRLAITKSSLSFNETVALLIGVVETVSILDDNPFNLDNIFGWSWMEYIVKVPAAICLLLLLLKLKGNLSIGLAFVGFAWAWADDIPPVLHVHTLLRAAGYYWYPFDILEHSASLLFFYLAVKQTQPDLDMSPARLS